MTRKILHAADIHLDSPLQKLTSYEDAPAERIRGASRVALENMVELAIEQAVDLVVIAGDLYDGDWPDQNTGLFFVKQASRLVAAGIPIVVIRGNHDAFNKMTLNLRLPTNPDGSEIMLSEREVDYREFSLGDLAVAVHGRSYRKQHERGDLVKDYPKPHAGMFNLGVLHTGLTGLDGHIAYAPCTPQQLADMEYDYWALGHIHQRGEHQVSGAAPVVFSGNVQGRHIREAGPKGCVIVDIDDRGGCGCTFHPLDVVRWELCSIDAADIKHPEDVAERFEAWLATTLAEVDDRLLVPRVELSGTTPLHGSLMRRFDSIEASLRSVAINTGVGQVWFERLKLRTSLPERTREQAGGNESVYQGSFASVESVVAELLCQAAPTGHSKPAVDGRLFSEQAESDGADSELVEPVSSTASWMEEELSSFLQKLPREFDSDDPLVNVRDESNVRSWIEQASAELMGRLQNAEDDAMQATTDGASDEH